MLYEIMFSPTGGSSKAARRLTAADSCPRCSIDLFRRDYARKLPELCPEDVCVIACPVFSGRIPSVAAQRLSELQGNGAAAVIMAVYGNRAVEDALLEMADILKQQGFRVAAGIEAVAEHSVDRRFGAGRPDKEDALCLQQFWQQIRAKLSSGDLSEPALPGNRPYRSPGRGLIPRVEAGCINCGICARECPAGAISFGGNWVADPEKCISCMHCIRFCPKSYRTLDPEQAAALSLKLSSLCSGRKENKLYL